MFFGDDNWEEEGSSGGGLSLFPYISKAEDVGACFSDSLRRMSGLIG